MDQKNEEIVKDDLIPSVEGTITVDENNPMANEVHAVEGMPDKTPEELAKLAGKAV